MTIGRISVVCRIGDERLNILEKMTILEMVKLVVFKHFRRNDNISNDFQIG